MTDLEDARRRWLVDEPKFAAFGKAIETRIDRAVQSLGIWRVCASRPKELHSLIKKLIKKPQHTYDSLPDKAGTRCVVKYTKELDPVVAEAERIFDCSNIERKVVGLGAEKIGYLGIHIDVKLRRSDTDFATYPDCCAELQVKTMAQQLWSEMSHDSVYKNDEALNALPIEYRRRVNLMAGLIEVADQEFDRLHSELPKDDVTDLYLALEKNYFKVAAKRPDPDISRAVIGLLFPLYGEGSRQVVERLERFFYERRATLEAIYAQADANQISALMYQPEAIMLYERLHEDTEATKRAWSREFPEKELERVANTFGVSFD